MSGVGRTIGQVAGVVASIASVIPGGQLIAGIAAGIALVANVATAKSPTAEGQINDRIIGANNPLPYLMGRSYSGGIQVHDVGYGGEVDDVENPYRFIATVHSYCGPVDGLESSQIGYSSTNFSGTAATGYFDEYLWRDFQLGQSPESGALQPHFSGTPDWGSSYKLSSCAAIGWSLKWSKKGKRFGGGQIPNFGAIWRGVRAYDPRLDSTYPGGSGPQRIDNESTWAYTNRPAQHALAYAYGRYANGKKVFGVDLGEASIALDDIVAWANVCDANNWTVSGTIYEPGDKWNNLKRICQAGGGQPNLTGGILHFDFHTPRISLADVGRDDLADGPIRSQLGRTWKTRHNTIVPLYRSEAHQWNYVQSEAIQNADMLAEDGEEKSDQVQFDLVDQKDQAAQLATLELFQRREDGPFALPFKPHMRGYGPGDCLTLLAELGVFADPGEEASDLKVVIRRRRIDTVSGTVIFEFESDRDTKYVEASVATGTAPSLINFATAEQLDAAYSRNSVPIGYITQQILDSYVTDADPADGLLSATDAQIVIEDHTRTYPDLDATLAVTGATLTTEDDGVTALDPDRLYHIYYDDLDRNGGAVTILASRKAGTAATSGLAPGRHYIGSIRTDVTGGTGTTSGGTSPGGWNGDDWRNEP